MPDLQPKKQWKRLLSLRLLWTGLLLLLQVCFVLLLAAGLSGLHPAWALGLRALSSGSAVWLLSQPLHPSYKIRWVILLVLLPRSGGLFYLCFGNKRLSHHRKKILKQYRAAALPAPQSQELLCRLEERQPGQARLARYLQQVAGAPLWSNTAAHYFPSGELLFQDLLQQLEEAKRFIFLEFFIVAQGELWDSILAILQKKAAQGLEVRLLYDDAGSINTLPDGYEETLRGYGIRTAIFNPLRPRLNPYLNCRDHRKICVIDGELGYTGGVNLADEYVNRRERCGHWKDSGLRLRGAAVESLNRLFLQQWQYVTGEQQDPQPYLPRREAEADGFVQVFGSEPISGRAVAKGAYLQLCNQASRSLTVFSPYLIPDDETLSTLLHAAASGVEVKLVLPHVPDKYSVHAVTRSYYNPLLKQGVRIFEYSPGFIHSKVLLADDNCAMIGSANLDYRSFYSNFECAALLYGCSAVEEIRQDVQATLALCQEWSLPQAQATPWPQKLLQLLLRSLAPLM